MAATWLPPKWRTVDSTPTNISTVETDVKSQPTVNQWGPRHRVAAPLSQILLLGVSTTNNTNLDEMLDTIVGKQISEGISPIRCRLRSAASLLLALEARRGHTSRVEPNQIDTSVYALKARGLPQRK